MICDDFSMKWWRLDASRKACDLVRSIWNRSWIYLGQMWMDLSELHKQMNNMAFAVTTFTVTTFA